MDGSQRPGRPKVTWKKLSESDCREWKLTTVDPQERSTWRSEGGGGGGGGGGGLTDVDIAPAPAIK